MFLFKSAIRIISTALLILAVPAVSLAQYNPKDKKEKPAPEPKPAREERPARVEPREIPREIPREVPREVPRQAPREIPRETPREATHAGPRENSGRQTREIHPETVPQERRVIEEPHTAPAGNPTRGWAPPPAVPRPQRTSPPRSVSNGRAPTGSGSTYIPKIKVQIIPKPANRAVVQRRLGNSIPQSITQGDVNGYNTKPLGPHRVIYNHRGSYGPKFYATTRGPFARAIAHDLGWGASPAAKVYGTYFTPYPSYRSASFFVTDAILTYTLNAQYADAEIEAPGDKGFHSVIDDEDKEDLREEVDQVIQDFPDGSTISLLNAFQSPKFVFVVFESEDGLSVVDNSDQTECKLFGGDLIRLKTFNYNIEDGPQAREMIVLSSKRGSCPTGTEINVNDEDLEAMLNEFSANVDDGLTTLQGVENVTD